MLVREYVTSDQTDIIELWRLCGLLRSWNNPVLDIERKLRVQPELFLVGERDGRLVASAMGGYDGHRGSVYYLAVHPVETRRGHGRQVLAELERRLVELGCPKLNVLVRSGNIDAREFYSRIGYEENPITCWGRRLIPD